ncbi:protein transport protein sec24-like cef [Quercus suber]|uniref:Protein transport protein sec24-like cef n=1 Tax=Quercus suber TaxID=58331 RepID=A0AAW0LWA5_QUESU
MRLNYTCVVRVELKYIIITLLAVSDPAKLYNDLRWNVTRPQGFEAVMRVRCSQGIQVLEYDGNFCKRMPTDVDLPGIDCDKTIMVNLKHDDKLKDGSECAFQCALLYTTVNGQRRIRVTTLSLHAQIDCFSDNCSFPFCYAVLFLVQCVLFIPASMDKGEFELLHYLCHAQGHSICVFLEASYFDSICTNCFVFRNLLSAFAHIATSNFLILN